MMTPPLAHDLLPGYLTADLPGTGGVIRAVPEDFIVEEIPLYGPTGEGQHTLFAIEKRELTTLQAIQQLARALKVPPRLIASAGLKDAHAITRQVLSVEGVDPAIVRAVELPRVRVLWAERHRNRLKIGHLKGNRFIIRIREPGPHALLRARRILEVLARRGVPNGFGYQRFGVRRCGHLLGRALVRCDLEGFFHFLLGLPLPDEPEEVQRARRLFDAGDWRGAWEAWPYRSGDEANLLAALAKRADLKAAYRGISPALRRLYAAAYQSYLFNRLLALRLPSLDRLEPGDLAIKHANGAFFLVEDAAAEQPRADALEISPSGPLYGPKVRLAQGAPGERERELLAAEGLSLEDWRVPGLRLEGGRRPLRVPLTEVDADYDQGLVLRFTLPAGAYATNVLREVLKVDGV
jgi:tRNA pseudouridine13 synthase